MKKGRQRSAVDGAPGDLRRPIVLVSERRARARRTPGAVSRPQTWVVSWLSQSSSSVVSLSLPWPSRSLPGSSPHAPAAAEGDRWLRGTKSSDTCEPSGGPEDTLPLRSDTPQPERTFESVSFVRPTNLGSRVSPKCVGRSIHNRETIVEKKEWQPVPGMEPRSQAWKPSAPPTKPRTQHAETGGAEAGGVTKRTEQRGVERVKKTGAEKQDTVLPPLSATQKSCHKDSVNGRCRREARAALQRSNDAT